MAPDDPEAVTDAKGWLRRHGTTVGGYRATVDQPALAQTFDLEAARIASSFDELYREVEALIDRAQAETDAQ